MIDRWRLEVQAALEEWPEAFLSQTRARVEQAFKETLHEISADRLSDREWSATHARHFVDRLGSLLELAWMSTISVAQSQKDATAALLTVAAAHDLLPGLSLFDSSGFFATGRYWAALIDEAPVELTLGQL
jgi:hypothetical protein